MYQGTSPPKLHLIDPQEDEFSVICINLIDPQEDEYSVICINLIDSHEDEFSVICINLIDPQEDEFSVICINLIDPQEGKFSVRRHQTVYNVSWQRKKKYKPTEASSDRSTTERSQHMHQIWD